MSQEDLARIDFFASGVEEPVASREFEATTSTQIMSTGKKMLMSERGADYAYVTWRGRRLTITYDTNVMGAY
ncbi:MAG: hypothetical protein Q4D06_09570 [Coriobacteriia bacterium]|nr:hypothetical protein [Coriobacteriia bacterium]